MDGISLRELVAITISTVCVATVCLASNSTFRRDRHTVQTARSLMEQCIRWTRGDATARVSLGTLRDSIYASAYLAAARSLLNDSDLSRSTGLNVHEIAAHTDERQAQLMRKFGKEMRMRRTAIPSRDSWKSG